MEREIGGGDRDGEDDGVFLIGLSLRLDDGRLGDM